MSMVRLAEYLFVKYAAHELETDISFGVPINAEKTRILKDKLAGVYDKIDKRLTKLPAFQQLNAELEGSPFLTAFRDAVRTLRNDVYKSSLKEGFSFAIRTIEALNQLQGILQFDPMNQDKKAQLSHAIRNVQDTIWEESKRFLNIHDLRGLELEFPELKGLLGQVIPTWDYGPGASIARKPLGQRYRQEKPKDMMKRLEEELALEKAKK